MPHISASKLTRSHTTIIDAAVDVVKLAQKMPEVTKISLGVIKSGLPSGVRRIKCKPIQGGLQVSVRGTNSKQDLYMYTKFSDTLTETITKFFI